MSSTKYEVKKEMIKIYGDSCWMGYKMTSENPYTYHHILEARNGGRITIENGAILTRFAHNDLNELERSAKYLYKELNMMFKELNKTKKPPTKEYFKEINGILLHASNIIELSNNCSLNKDGVMQEEYALKFIEENKKIKTNNNYRDYIEIDSMNYPCKIKSKNREKSKNNKRYIYY